MLFSTETDPDLPNRPPERGHKYLRHQSFGASLVQVIYFVLEPIISLFYHQHHFGLPTSHNNIDDERTSLVR